MVIIKRVVKLFNLTESKTMGTYVGGQRKTKAVMSTFENSFEMIYMIKAEGFVWSAYLLWSKDDSCHGKTNNNNSKTTSATTL